MKIWFGVFAISVLSGCAIHYYDPESQADHIIGIGHMVMKAQNEKGKTQAIVRGIDILGTGIGKDDENISFILGWNRVQRIDIIDQDTEIELFWPKSSVLNVYIDSESNRSTTYDFNNLWC